MRTRLAFLLLIILAATVPAGAKDKPIWTQEFTIAGMSCPKCAVSATEVLEKIRGVHAAKVEFDGKSVRLEATREISREQIEKALGALGFEPRFPGDPITEPLTEQQKAGLDIAVASEGEAFELADHLAPGKITIFDYHADWCGPCHLLTPKLERLLIRIDGLALRTVDISDWESEAAKQADIPGLPFVRIYGPRGEMLGSVHGNHIEKVEEILQRAAR